MPAPPPARLRHTIHTDDTYATCSPAKAFSDPVMTITPISLSASADCSALVSSAISAMLSALSALGLLSVTSAARGDVIMFSYFTPKADAGDAEDADAVVDIDVDMNVGTVNRAGVIKLASHGEEKTVVARASWRRKTDMMW